MRPLVMDRIQHNPYVKQRLEKHYLFPTDSAFRHSLWIVTIFDYVKLADLLFA